MRAALVRRFCNLRFLRTLLVGIIITAALDLAFHPSFATRCVLTIVLLLAYQYAEDALLARRRGT